MLATENTAQTAGNGPTGGVSSKPRPMLATENTAQTAGNGPAGGVTPGSSSTLRTENPAQVTSSAPVVAKNSSSTLRTKNPAQVTSSAPVVAENAAGSVIGSGTLRTTKSATSAPAFTVQPMSQSTPVGSSVTFTAAASGLPTPTYQWKKNGVNIAGATSASYTISSVKSSDAGTYTVVATNSLGRVMSARAALKIKESLK
jgi:hypothetical protein